VKGEGSEREREQEAASCGRGRSEVDHDHAVRGRSDAEAATDLPADDAGVHELLRPTPKQPAFYVSLQPLEEGRRATRAMLDRWLEGRTGLWKRIVIPAELKWVVRDKLDQANVPERVLFPGLDGLSRWLKRHYTAQGGRAKGLRDLCFWGCCCAHVGLALQGAYSVPVEYLEVEIQGQVRRGDRKADGNADERRDLGRPGQSHLHFAGP
jgi:hypothetical protein